MSIYDVKEERYVPADVGASAGEAAAIEAIWKRLTKQACDSGEDRGVIAYGIWNKLTAFLTHPASPHTVTHLCQDIKYHAEVQSDGTEEQRA
jgi:hypothetical protein